MNEHNYNPQTKFGAKLCFTRVCLSTGQVCLGGGGSAYEGRGGGDSGSGGGLPTGGGQTLQNQKAEGTHSTRMLSCFISFQGLLETPCWILSLMCTKENVWSRSLQQRLSLPFILLNINVSHCAQETSCAKRLIYKQT